MSIWCGLGGWVLQNRIDNVKVCTYNRLCQIFSTGTGTCILYNAHIHCILIRNPSIKKEKPFKCHVELKKCKRTLFVGHLVCIKICD